MRRRVGLGLVPVLLATMAALATPAPALAAAEVVETGVTTYKVNVAKSEIDVTTQLSITNNKKPTSCGPSCTTSYSLNEAYVAVEVEATNVKATSNAGKVKASVYKTTNYYREYLLTYPSVYYKQTRVVTVTYTIPAAPHAKGGYRAVKAYAELCAAGNGVDTGKVNVLVPSGYDVTFYAGANMTRSGESGGFVTYTSGTISAPYNFWSCLEAENPGNLTSNTVTAGDQTFNVEAWPEDTTWTTSVSTDVAAYTPKLEDLTGLTMPGGTIAIQEAGYSQLGDYAGTYNSETRTATVSEGPDDATIAHELSHIWFNKSLFAANWMNEGLASFSEQVAGPGKYTPCKDPGTPPEPTSLNNWHYLDMNSTATDQQIVDWQYAASCYLFTDLAGLVGPDGFKAILQAASKNEIAYVGAGPAEKSPTGAATISVQALLDLIDERGMVPAGVKDLDQVQTLFADYGTGLSTSDLTARSRARTAYHALAAGAGTWKMPYAIRKPMATWDFESATAAMDAATQILALRAQIEGAVAGVKLDGTVVQSQFEGAQTQADLDATLALAKEEADAAAKVAQAIALNGGSHSMLQSVGLIGSDPASLVVAATDALKQIHPDEATASAQSAIDMIDRSGDQGTLRLGALIGLLLALVLLVVSLFVYRGRRRARAMAMAPVAPPDAMMSAGVWTPPAAPGTPQWGAAPYGSWQPAAPEPPSVQPPGVEPPAETPPPPIEPIV